MSTGRILICRISLLLIIVFSFSVAKEQTMNSSEQKIKFSGFTWAVRNTLNKQGPGPNYFKTDNVRVDEQGYLHLLITKNPASGEWTCAEITMDSLLGYGTYQFVVDGPIDKTDKNVVLGLFNYSGNDGLDEMDIEFARWGNNNYPNLNYTIWPAEPAFKNASAVKEFSLESNVSTHYFRRTADSVICSSFNGDTADADKLIYSSIFTKPAASISKLSMPVHINLWLFNGDAPTDQKTFEVIVRSFVFKR
ncbi:MAG TPA: glycoside hydrolase family 16 protein [Chitinophagaceae bacterium]